MGLSTEPLSTLEKWLVTLWGRIATGGTIAAWIALSVWMTTDSVGRLSLLVNGAQLTLVAILYLRLRQIRKDRDSLKAELAMPRAEPWEPDNDARTILCFFVDAYPQHFEPHEVQESLGKTLSEAKIEWALELLVRNGYLKFDDGRGPVPGYDPYPENYSTTTKGRIYVEDWRRERGL